MGRVFKNHRNLPSSSLTVQLSSDHCMHIKKLPTSQKGPTEREKMPCIPIRLRRMPVLTSQTGKHYNHGVIGRLPRKDLPKIVRKNQTYTKQLRSQLTHVKSKIWKDQTVSMQLHSKTKLKNIYYLQFIQHSTGENSQCLASNQRSLSKQRSRKIQPLMRKINELKPI